MNLPLDLQRKLDTLPPYLKTRDAAKLRGCCDEVLRRKAREGKVVSVMDGQTRLYSTRSILEDLAQLTPAEERPVPANLQKRVRGATS
jgi:hypothetical protein